MPGQTPTGVSCRDVLALRVLPWPPPFSMQGRTADDMPTEHVQAIGIARFVLSSDAEGMRFVSLGSDAAAVPRDADGKPVFLEANGFDHETEILYWLANEMGRVSTPVIVTAGGRANDIPLLLRRALARSVPLRALFLTLGGRSVYFDGLGGDWHVDFSELLVPPAFGPVPMLGDLCQLIGESTVVREDPLEASKYEAQALGKLFARLLFVQGRLSPAEYAKAAQSLGGASIERYQPNQAQGNPSDMVERAAPPRQNTKKHFTEK